MIQASWTMCRRPPFRAIFAEHLEIDGLERGSDTLRHLIVVLPALCTSLLPGWPFS
jgi:hypothetical protein